MMSTKKEAKKAGKMLSIISRQLGVPRSNEPQEWTLIWGAGLALGSPKLALFNFLQPAPSEIRYYNNVPFCAARFESKTLAAAAKSANSGAIFHGSQPVYIGFAAKEPPPEDTSALDVFSVPWPNGLFLLENFITEAEEKEFLQLLYPVLNESDTTSARNIQLHNTTVEKFLPQQHSKLKQRAVQHFGYEFRYKTNDVDLDYPNAEAIPAYMVPVFFKMMENNVIQRKPEQITVNYYSPGQGIPPHVDTHSAFEQPIMSLSLGAPVVMDFRHGDTHCSVVLPPRSLLVMKDEARYLWTHGIASRKYDVVEDKSGTGFGLNVVARGFRVSVTFRLIRENQICDCNFPEMCDSQKAKLSNETAPKIEEDLVHKVYDEIAEHFSQTRHTPWPRVKSFLEKIVKGQSVLDVGCGNGKYFNLTDYIYEVGMDMSKALLKIAKEKTSVDGVRANCLQIPFRDNSFDAIICIAVLHHLVTQERRVDALREIYRVLAPGGRALIYVWAQDQRLKEVKSAYARQKALKAGMDPDMAATDCVPKDYSFLPVHQHEENFLFNDMLVPWMNKNSKDYLIVHRFYHVFKRGELEGLIDEMGVIPPPRIVDSYYDQGNWCVEIKKMEDHFYS